MNLSINFLLQNNMKIKIIKNQNQNAGFFKLFIISFFDEFLQGLKLGDQILKFGTITSKNFNGLASIGSLVQHSKGVCFSLIHNIMT